MSGANINKIKPRTTNMDILSVQICLRNIRSLVDQGKIYLGAIGVQKLQEAEEAIESIDNDDRESRVNTTKTIRGDHYA